VFFISSNPSTHPRFKPRWIKRRARTADAGSPTEAPSSPTGAGGGDVAAKRRVLPSGGGQARKSSMFSSMFFKAFSKKQLM
jgi:hypothetical protein